MKEIAIKSEKVNLIGFLSILPITLLILIPFWLKWGSFIKADIKRIKSSLFFFDNNLINAIIVIFAPVFLILIGIILHELIHGLFMVIFSKNGIKSVKIGIIKNSFILYAHCSEPLKSKKMLVISLAPFVFLGLFPTLYAYKYGDLIVWFIGFSMTLSAIGDFIYAYLILKTGLNHIILDHDSKVGFNIIE